MIYKNLRGFTFTVYAYGCASYFLVGFDIPWYIWKVFIVVLGLDEENIFITEMVFHVYSYPDWKIQGRWCKFKVEMGASLPKGSFFIAPWYRGICGYINIPSLLPVCWFVRELMIMVAQSLDAAQGRDEMGCCVVKAVKAVRGGERRGCLFLVAAHCLGGLVKLNTVRSCFHRDLIFI